jgi:hypothetical protein
VLAASEYSPAQLAEYGLDPPRFALAVAEADGNPTRLGFGEATPAQNARIVGRPEPSAASVSRVSRSITEATRQRRARLTSLNPAALDPQRKLSGEDAPLQSVRGRYGGRERDERQDRLQTVRTELDPVDYRLEQISSSGIGQQALSLALCFSQ